MKLLAGLGGWNSGSANFSIMAQDEELRNSFASEVLEFLNLWGFDGIDFDWEYPAQRGGGPDDKENLILLLKALRLALDDKIIAMAVAATEKSASISYDIPKLADQVDFINLMSYDLHGSWNDFTGFYHILEMLFIVLLQFHYHRNSWRALPWCRRHYRREKNFKR